MLDEISQLLLEEKVFKIKDKLDILDNEIRDRDIYIKNIKANPISRLRYPMMSKLNSDNLREEREEAVIELLEKKYDKLYEILEDTKDDIRDEEIKKIEAERKLLEIKRKNEDYLVN